MDEIEDAVAAGIEPVMKLDQATGLCGGIASRADESCRPLRACEKFGIRPCAIRSRVSA